MYSLCILISWPHEAMLRGCAFRGNAVETWGVHLGATMWMVGTSRNTMGTGEINDWLMVVNDWLMVVNSGE